MGKDEIDTLRDKIEQDAVGLGVDLDAELSKVTAMRSAVTTRVDALKKVDREKGYHCLTATKAKDNIVFPKTFDGVLGSNVYKFRREIEDAIDSSQVKEDDKVKLLRKHLSGDTKAKVGEHHRTLGSALNALQDHPM